MADLKIRKYPDEVLRKKAVIVSRIGDGERKLAYAMIHAMRSNGGIGLAAPQVGVSRRIIVVEDFENKNSALVLINPKILKKKGKNKFCEGCLSVPGIQNDVIRPETILLEALNIDGKILRFETGGLLSRVIQHEVDHLEGILFIDRLGFLKRKKVIKSLDARICVEL